MADIQRLEKQALRFDQETIDKAVESIQKLSKALVDVWEKIVELVRSIFNTFWEGLREFLRQTNPKLYHLAYHHKKQKTRKKNQARLFRLFSKCIK